MSNDTDHKKQKPRVLEKTAAVASCPEEGDSKWNHHPKVFLNLNHENEVKCPYCGKSFIRVVNDNCS
ncbi:MAG: hypothetical protein CMK52_04215 [Proteobacteria bacterium]|nr:hypothetical protein [Pseudomonadota bacterium]